MKSLSKKNKIIVGIVASLLAIFAVFAIDISVSAQKNVFADVLNTKDCTQDEYVEAIFDMCGGDVDAISDDYIKEVMVNALNDNAAVRAQWTLLSLKNPNEKNEKIVITSQDDNNQVDQLSGSESSADQNQQYKVDIAVADGGVVSGQGLYIKGQAATVKAAPKIGYKFNGWYNGDKLLTTNETYTQAFDKNVTLNASFVALGNAAVVINNDGHVFSTITVNGKEYDGKTSNPIIETYIGANIAITDIKPYDSNSNVSFKFWVNKSGHILSTSLQYGFVVTSSTEIMPVIDRSDQGYATVEYISAYNQVVGGGQYKYTDSIDVPPVPTRLGFETIGWDKTPDQIKAEIAGGSTNITVYPLYKKNENTVIVSVNYVDGDGKVIAGADPVVIHQDDGITPDVIDVPGYTFSCWKDSRGNILSANSYLFVTPHNDLTITAEYVGPGQIPAKDSLYLTTLEKFKVDSNDGNKKVCFKFLRHVPDGYTVLDSGVLRCRYDYLATENNLILSNVDGKEILKYNNFSTENNNLVMTMLSRVSKLDMTIWARAYAEVQDADGNYYVGYSDIQSGSYNSLGY